MWLSSAGAVCLFVNCVCVRVTHKHLDIYLTKMYSKREEEEIIKWFSYTRVHIHSTPQDDARSIQFKERLCYSKQRRKLSDHRMTIMMNLTRMINVHLYDVIRRWKHHQPSVSYIIASYFAILSAKKIFCWFEFECHNRYTWLFSCWALHHKTPIEVV